MRIVMESDDDQLAVETAYGARIEIVVTARDGNADRLVIFTAGPVTHEQDQGSSLPHKLIIGEDHRREKEKGD